MSMRKVSLSLYILMLFVFTACEDNYQGGNLESEFQGLLTATSISPYTVHLTWEKESDKFISFNIYQSGINDPIRNETFARANIGSLQPNTSYNFTVTAIKSDGIEEGRVDNIRTARTFPKFEGLDTNALTVVSATRIDMDFFVQDPSVEYKIYVRKEGETWDFLTPNLIYNEENRSLFVTGLEGGTKYCFYATATYLDGVTEPATDDVARVNANAPCATTNSSLLNIPAVSINNVTPGRFPWFAARAGDPTYTIEVFDRLNDLRVASRIGNGNFRSFETITPGVKDYYAVVRSPDGEQATIDVTLSGTSTEKTQTRYYESSGTNGPNYPILQGNGRGQQRLGQNVARGDFNCDGVDDLAVAAPNATPYITPRNNDRVGAVVVYYGVDPPFDPITLTNPPPFLDTSGTPTEAAIAPNPQLIYFPVTFNDVSLGRRLAVGNVNGDCRRTNASPTTGNCDTILAATFSSDYPTIHSCDDLAMTNDRGEVFVVFGDPLSGLVSGSGGNNFGINETTCSSTCRTVRLTPPADYSDYGRSIAFGDYNNDGYDDLAIYAFNDLSGYPEIHVLRGSAQGVTPFGLSSNFPTIRSESAAQFAFIDGAVTTNDDFGFSIATAYNSRDCLISNGFRPGISSADLGYDEQKCDDLVIGAPSRSTDRGSIFTCKGEFTGINLDDWTCVEHYPAELETPTRITANYGWSILGVENQNGYPLDNVTGAPNVGDIAGALFVGAPGANVSGEDNAGKVYGYYVTPTSQGQTAGGIQGILGAAPHDINAPNMIPCDAVNKNVSSTAGLHCHHQSLIASPPEENAQFGYSLASIPDVEDGARGLPSLAVGAPFKNQFSPGGGTINNAGAIYLFRPDTSTFGIDSASQVTQTIRTANTNISCNSAASPLNCTWYSGGVSPFGPSIVYPLDLNSDANFGLSIAGGDFNGDALGDIMGAAPGLTEVTSDNGALYSFFSIGNFGAVVNNEDLKVDENISKDLGYQYQMARVIGDINADGFDDVVSKVSWGNATQLILFYGSISGLITTPAPSINPIGLSPLIINVNADNNAGEEFFPAGSINGDAYDDILLFGDDGAYIYNGSFSGLVAGIQPSIQPIGNNPLFFARWTDATGVYLRPSIGNFNAFNNSYNYSMHRVSHGDFNGDGFEDLAIGMDHNLVLPADANPDALDYSAANDGRVYILYGSKDGLQVPRNFGTIQISDGSTDTAYDVVSKNPCTPGADPVCKVQMIAENTGNGELFGFSLAAIESFEFSSGEFFDELVVGDPNHSSNDGRVFLYKGTPLGLNPASLQTLVPKFSDNQFGRSIAYAGDINRDLSPDIVIGAPADPGYAYVFYSGTVGGQTAFFGESGLNAGDFWASVGLNQMHADFTQPHPQVLQNFGVTDVENFAEAVAGVQDFNQDGYNDIIVTAPRGLYNNEVTQAEVGYSILYFGSDLGVQSLTTASETPLCVLGASLICDPFLIFLPDREEFETMYLSPSPSGDINGDGIPELILGGVGRSHPSGQAFAVGVFYVMY